MKRAAYLLDNRLMQNITNFYRCTMQRIGKLAVGSHSDGIDLETLAARISPAIGSSSPVTSFKRA